MFKRVLLLSSAISVLMMMPVAIAPAGAADLPPPPPPPLRPALDFYFGGVGGIACAVVEAGIASEDPTVVIGDPPVDLEGCTFSGGGFVGFNHRLFDSIVVGVEGDFVVQSGQYETITTPGGRIDVDTDFISTVRGRLGYQASDRALLYVTGGVAFADADQEGFSPGGVAFSDEQFFVGFAVGGGIDYAITENIQLRAEYLFVDLGEETFDASPGFTGAALDTDIEQIHQIRFGASYHFDPLALVGF